jgi:ArsR family transcriptional regulator
MDEVRLLKALKALAHPRRFKMIREIAAAGELSCRQIGERFPLSQPTVSHHLKILGEAGLLQIRQDAQHHFVSVNRGLIQQVVSVLPASLAVVPARNLRKAAGGSRRGARVKEETTDPRSSGG